MLPSDQASRQLRKFCLSYSGWHPEADAVRQAFIAVRDAEQWHQVILTWYAEDLPGRFPADPGNTRTNSSLVAADSDRIANPAAAAP
jgi:hypothetical protein